MTDSPWFLSYAKLRFFVRIRRFLRKKRGKNFSSSNRWEAEKVETEKEEEEEEEEEERGKKIGEETVNKGLFDEKEREIDKGFSQLQRSVKQLHFGNGEEKEKAAKEITRLAKLDLQTRKSLADLGVIPCLVSMLDSDFHGYRRPALQALIELSNGTYTNKSLMVDAGILAKLPELLNTLDESIKEEFVIILLSISSLANTQLYIATSEILPFLMGILDSGHTNQEIPACLATLYNLSTMLENTESLVSNGAVHVLLKLSSENDASERALATLGNLVVTVTGKKAMENDPLVPKSLMEILTWETKPRCQELAAYILMVLAHRSHFQREKMRKAGIVPVLLEVALLGSPLAQKRAVRILQWFKDERKTAMAAHSGPQTGRFSPASSPVNQRESKEGRNAIKRMVKQSLDKNMELITKRANGSCCNGEASKLKALVISSSSKSLPY